MKFLRECVDLFEIKFDVWPPSHTQFKWTRKAGEAPDHVLSLACLVTKVRRDTRILKHNNFVCVSVRELDAAAVLLRGNNPG